MTSNSDTRPLILITNDDSVHAKGIKVLTSIAREFGDVVVMAPETNSSGLSQSLTMSRPLRVRKIIEQEGLHIYACDGTPTDCVKLGSQHFCPRKPNLILSGINHGSNSSINILYSGTMGAVIEATANGFDAIGFSLLNHSTDADFTPGIPYIKEIIAKVLQHGLPDDVSLNVNIPDIPAEEIKGIRVCREAKAAWTDSFEERHDPAGRPYWWLTGEFVCNDKDPNTDEGALCQGYVSVVPVPPDYTCHEAIPTIKELFNTSER